MSSVLAATRPPAACLQCGNAHLDDSEFCRECGTNLKFSSKSAAAGCDGTAQGDRTNFVAPLAQVAVPLSHCLTPLTISLSHS